MTTSSNSTQISLEKSKWRAKAKKMLQKITPHNEISHQIMTRIITHPTFQASNSILLYAALPDEIATHDLFEFALSKQKLIYFPYSKKIQIGRITSWEELVPSKHGLLEPKSADLSVPTIDLAIIPGLAFDQSGYRLGRGAGWYDRFLIQFSVKSKLGICPSRLLFESIPHEKHDQKMDWIVTEMFIKSTLPQILL
ncbi:MAG: 5-formyltetrahydrofolate cyclo-ligase [bacterium]